MRFVVALMTLTLSVLTAGGSASGQQIDDELNCRALAKPGLYYLTYPEGGSPVIIPVNAASIRYQANSRFYFLTSPRAQLLPEGGEAVWHIRTQTRASAAPAANTVYVYRPAITTQCSPTALPEYPPDQRFVEINRYIDYHAPNNNGRQPNPGLHEYFHFAQRDVSTGRCIRTDDRNVYGNLADVYGFPDISRTDTQTIAENRMSISSTAFAARSRYQGLSSEFAYRGGSSTRCFAFTAPLPTGPVTHGWFASPYSAALEAARNWHPVSTLVVVKRLRGGKVLEVISQNIRWTN